MATPSLESLLKLPKKRRMEIAERLWLSAADERDAPVPEEHEETVNERVEDYRAGKSVPVSHAEMMKQLRAR